MRAVFHQEFHYIKENCCMLAVLVKAAGINCVTIIV